MKSGLGLLFQIAVRFQRIRASRRVCGQPGQPAARLKTADRHITLPMVEDVLAVAAAHQFPSGVLQIHIVSLRLGVV